ncbi:MAG: type 4a pilus biogenesis protein PilO [Candidatus Omnitrophica bacterium]|nr:type 4a pilus biogenesis protein PilO [Candidatus Omnitrophota bacterium]
MGLPRLPRGRPKPILFGIAGLIGLALWASFFLLPQQRGIGERGSQIRELKEKLGRARKDLAALPAVRADLARMEAQGEGQALLQPAEEQLPDLLDSISKMARGAQVRLLVVKPKEGLSSLTAGPGGFLELPIQVEALAGYHQIGVFLDSLERSERLIGVREFEIRGDSRDPWHHRVIFLLQAYLAPGGAKRSE